MSNDKVKLAPISDELHEALDRERSTAYGDGATAVWSSVGVGAGAEFPNEAVFNMDTKFYDIRPKTDRAGFNAADRAALMSEAAPDDADSTMTGVGD
jgi:hypothetical protein